LKELLGNGIESTPKNADEAKAASDLADKEATEAGAKAEYELI